MIAPQVTMPDDPEISALPDPIIVVEDHPLHGRLLQLALEGRLAGRPVEVFADGAMAAARLGDPERPVPALLVLDLDVPGRNGHELLLACSRDPRLARVPAAVLTSSGAAADRERSLALGASLHVSKPADGAGFEELAGRLAAPIG